MLSVKPCRIPDGSNWQQFEQVIDVKPADSSIKKAVHAMERYDPQAVKKRDRDHASRHNRTPKGPTHHPGKSEYKANSARRNTGKNGPGLKNPPLVILHLLDQVATQGLANHFLGPVKPEHGEADEDPRNG